MSAYSSYDGKFAPRFSLFAANNVHSGVAVIADYHLLTEILREEWGYEYWITSDAGATDRVCDSFKMCQSDPIDKEAVTMFVGTISSGTLTWYML